MDRVVAIIQARLGSTRLPGKVLLPLAGIPVLAWVIRAAKAAQSVDAVWLAIPQKDYPLAKIAVDHGLDCWCGSEDDVLQRYKDAAVASKADIIVRLTGDCPFLDPWLIDQCVEHRSSSTENWPDGMDVQVFRTFMLEYGDKEHVVSPKWIMPQLKCSEGNLRHVRVTLDTQQDLLDLRWIASKLPDVNRPPAWREVLDAVRGFKGALGTGEEAHTIGESDVQQSMEPVAAGEPVLS